MEEDSGPHVGVEKGFEDVVDLVEQPRMVDDVDRMGGRWEARLK